MTTMTCSLEKKASVKKNCKKHYISVFF